MVVSSARVARFLALSLSWTLFAVAGQAQVARPGATDAPQWGGVGRVLYSVGQAEFTPKESSTPYSTSFGRYSTVQGGAFYASLHLPSGALLTYFELDYCDNSGPLDVVLELYDCDYLTTQCDLLVTLVSGGGPFGCNQVNGDITALGRIVDNNSRRYFLQAFTNSGNNLNQITGAYIGYKLQVSPAPPSATFLDVPTGHPYFRFVEALAAAGITGGCGGGNYCVNSPITRGEMAVFLAAALGLHFPN
ncbi:MAG TPA: S-layer homology domain-containing protein [Thermoanaerobaculia bacterium]|jgi:hypothetical protein